MRWIDCHKGVMFAHARGEGPESYMLFIDDNYTRLRQNGVVFSTTKDAWEDMHKSGREAPWKHVAFMPVELM